MAEVTIEVEANSPGVEAGAEAKLNKCLSLHLSPSPSNRRRSLSLLRRRVGVMGHSPRGTCATPVVGARFLNFLSEWESITPNRFVLEIVGRGLSLVFQKMPPLSSVFLPFSLPPSGSEKRMALLGEIEKTAISSWSPRRQADFAQ